MENQIKEILENVIQLLEQKKLKASACYLIGSALENNGRTANDVDLILIDEIVEDHVQNKTILSKLSALYHIQIESHFAKRSDILNPLVKIPTKEGILRFHLLEGSEKIWGEDLDLRNFENTKEDLINLNQYYLTKLLSNHNEKQMTACKVCKAVLDNPSVDWKRPWTKNNLIEQMKSLKLL